MGPWSEAPALGVPRATGAARVSAVPARSNARPDRSRGRVGSDDVEAARPGSARVDLPQLFRLLTRLRTSLGAYIDGRLRAEHGLRWGAFQAMTAISDQSDDCDDGTLASALSVALDEVCVLVDALVSSGYAMRRIDARDASPRVCLTLRGSRLLGRANRTVDLELNRTIGSVLSPSELAQLEHSLAALGVGRDWR